MGSEVELVVTAPGRAVGRLLDRAVARVAQLEQRWSRFIPDSEISRLGRADGRPLAVSDDTLLAVRRVLQAHDETGGRFDPTVAEVMEQLGYDRTFAAVVERPTARSPRSTYAAGWGVEATVVPGCAGMTVDDDAGTVTVPSGVRLDLGAIGKGLAADVVAVELRDAGADGVCLNVGGDLRVIGTPPEGDAWTVSVECPFEPADEVARVALRDGGVATSSPRAKRWQHDGAVVTHIVDPATGRPLRAGAASVTVLAGEAWWAEVVATACIVAGPDAALATAEALGADAIVVPRHGALVSTPGMADFLRPHRTAVVPCLES
jgi:thiamine biosynthesis lipoprotein